jgi:hypothetical protein
MKTLATLRGEVFNALGFVTPWATVQTRTLAQLRTSMLAIMGHAAQAASPPPGVLTLVDELLNNAQDTLARRFEVAGSAVSRLTSASDVCAVDAPVLLDQAAADGKAQYGDGASARIYQDKVERYVQDLERRRPRNAMSTITQLLQASQDELWRRLRVQDTERMFEWTLVDGQALYAIDGDDGAGPRLDPLRVNWVGVVRDGIWQALTPGIAPERYTQPEWSGWPTRYEMRDQIELWPVPGAEAQKLVIKGHAHLGAFASDNDLATVDPHAIFLLTTARAKKAYGQQDADTYFGMTEGYVRGMVAGQHQTRRYVPGEGADARIYVAPRPSEPFA